MTYRQLFKFLIVACSFPVIAEEPKALAARVFAESMPGKGIVILKINWGRKWGCAGAENAQLQRLSFSQLPLSGASATLDLKTPSKLFVDDRFVLYSYVVEPGTYAISAFDVKVAKSTRDVGHIVGSSDHLFEGEKPKGGTFEVVADEAVYIGHFGLDCAQEIIPWRYYIEERAGFDSLVSEFGRQFPFASALPIRYRLFSTTTFGQPYSLPDELKEAVSK